MQPAQALVEDETGHTRAPSRAGGRGRWFLQRPGEGCTEAEAGQEGGAALSGGPWCHPWLWGVGRSPLSSQELGSRAQWPLPSRRPDAPRPPPLWGCSFRRWEGDSPHLRSRGAHGVIAFEQPGKAEGPSLQPGERGLLLYLGPAPRSPPYLPPSCSEPKPKMSREPPQVRSGQQNAQGLEIRAQGLDSPQRGTCTCVPDRNPGRGSLGCVIWAQLLFASGSCCVTRTAREVPADTASLGWHLLL